jgi:hypothetical protein
MPLLLMAGGSVAPQEQVIKGRNTTFLLLTFEDYSDECLQKTILK